MSSEKTFERFFVKAPLVDFKKKQIIFRPAETIKYVYLIIKGSVRLYFLSDEGEELTIYIYKASTCIPIWLLMNNLPSRYFYEAYTPIVARRLPAEKLLKKLKNEPELLYELATRFAKGLYSLSTRIESLMKDSAYEKISYLLSYLAYRFGSFRNQDSQIEISLTQAEIASWTGINRETVTRQINKLKKNGLIAYKNRKIIIKDLAKLSS